MSKEPPKKFRLITGEGEVGPSADPARAEWRVIVNEGRDSAEPRTPEDKLAVNLAKIEDSGFIHDPDIYPIHQALVLVFDASSRMPDDMAEYATEILAHAQNIPREAWAVILDDSLDMLKQAYDFINQEYFTRERQEGLIELLSPRASGGGGLSGLWQDEELRHRLMDSLRLSYDLAALSTERVGMTPYDLIGSLQQELMKRGTGIDPTKAETTEHMVAYQNQRTVLSRNAWALLSQELKARSNTGA